MKRFLHWVLFLADSIKLARSQSSSSNIMKPLMQVLTSLTWELFLKRLEMHLGHMV
jgi:hypothetical protein